MELAKCFRRKRLAAFGGVLALLAIAGAAYATIPDSKGVFTACVDSSGGVRLIDPGTSSCTSGESQVNWNQQGQPGVSPTVAQLQAGDSHCPAGGAAITDAADNTAYVCSAPSNGTFTSPDGQYSLAVGDTGVSMTGPGASITISGNSIAVKASGDETITVGHDRSETVGNNETTHVQHDRSETVDHNETTHVQHDRSETVDNNETITIGGSEKAQVQHDRSETVDNNETITIGGSRSETVGQNGTITIHGDRTESVGGTLTIHGGKGCRPVARLGDTISVSAKRITSGSPVVCVP